MPRLGICGIPKPILYMAMPPASNSGTIQLREKVIVPLSPFSSTAPLLITKPKIVKFCTELGFIPESMRENAQYNTVKLSNLTFNAT